MVIQVVQSARAQEPDNLDLVERSYFRTGWYIGYGTGALLTERGAAKTLSGAARVATYFDRVQTAVDAGRGYYILTKSYGYGVARRATVGTADELRRVVPDGVSARRAADALKGVSVVRSQRVVRTLDRVPDGTLRRLSDSVGERATVRFLARYGSSGVKLLKGLGQVPARRLVALQDRVRFQRQLVEAYRADPAVSPADIGEAVRRYDTRTVRLGGTADDDTPTFRLTVPDPENLDGDDANVNKSLSLVHVRDHRRLIDALGATW
jgi:hypothetical protein